jgi:SAM-dependent methyltransferase
MGSTPDRRGLAQHALRWPWLVHLYETRLWRRSPRLAQLAGISFERESALLHEAAGLETAERVLDLGCGTGITSRPFAERLPGGLVVGLDVLPPMLHYARKRGRAYPNLHWVRASAQGLPLAGAAFDVVNCCGALHNFPDLDGALAEVERVLRPGGRFTVAAYREGAPARFERLRRRIRAAAFSVDGLERSCARAGLGDFECLHEGPGWLLAAATKGGKPDPQHLTTLRVP